MTNQIRGSYKNDQSTIPWLLLLLRFVKLKPIMHGESGDQINHFADENQGHSIGNEHYGHSTLQCNMSPYFYAIDRPEWWRNIASPARPENAID